MRSLAVDASGRVFTVPYYDYLVEAWSPDGERIVGYRGPTLNAKEPLPGRWSADNPPPNRLFALQIDPVGYLWIVSWRLKDEWQDGMVETVLPSGQITYGPVNQLLSSIYRTRLEVVDLNEGAIIASQERDELFLAFVGAGLILEARQLESGISQVAVWSISFRNPNGR
jgi:hypothetical protein